MSFSDKTSCEGQIPLTLVITGGSRHNDLDRFFESLRAQTDVLYELVFVNQGDYDANRRALLPSGTFLKIVTLGGPTPLSRARNSALAAGIRGGIIAFPDDDCWYPTGLLASVIQKFREDNTIDCLCVGVFDPVHGKTYGHRPLGVRLNVTYHNLFRLPVSVGIFVRRCALERIGLFFDEGLGAGTAIGSGEETDLVARLLDIGAAVRYDGSLSVYHPSDDLTLASLQKCNQYGRGFGVLHRRLICHGRFGVIYFLVIVIVRSLGGAVFHWREPALRGAYWARFTGIVMGLLRG